MKNLPITARYDGAGAFQALGRSCRECDANFVIGHKYILDELSPRSQASHNHFFACVTEGWRNLREDDADRFPTPEHLRKWALIQGGYRDERSIVCSSKTEAERVAAFISPIDDHSVVTVVGAVVRVYTPQSQSLRAMGGKDFQRSKDVVLGYISGLIGVSPDALAKHGETA